MPSILPPLSREEPAPGLVIWQPERGFRYSLDAFALAAWALEGGRPRSALDVGTGSGIVALLLRRAGVGEVRGIDVQPAWMELARRSARDSGLDVAFEQTDIRGWKGPRQDLVLCNPPFRPQGSGPVSPDPLRAAARHELHGSLAEIIAGMARAGERLCLVLPQGREREAIVALAAEGRPLVRRCWLGERLVLLEGRPTGSRLVDETVPLGDDLLESPRVRDWYALLGVRLSSTRSPPPRMG